MLLSLVRILIVICIISAADSIAPVANFQPSGICTLTMNGKCIAVTGGATGRQIGISTCNGSPAQTWTLSGDGFVRQLGKCMGIGDGIEILDCGQAATFRFLTTGQLMYQYVDHAYPYGYCVRVQNYIFRDGQPLATGLCATYPDDQIVIANCIPIPPITITNPQPKGTCTITLGGRCIDVQGGNGASGTPFVVYTCNGAPAQQLSVPGDGTIKVYGKCMGVKSTDNLTPIQLYDCTGGQGQQWIFLSSNQIKNQYSNKCLHVLDGNVIQNGQPLVVYDCSPYYVVNQATDGKCQSTPPIIQLPPMTPQPTGSCKITVGDKCVDIIGGNSASGTPFDIYACNAAQPQYLSLPGDGTVRAFEKCMGVTATSSLTPVQLYDCTGGQGQQWIFLSSNQIKNRYSNRCLQVQGGGVFQDGQRLIISDCSPTYVVNQAFVGNCEPIITPPYNPQPKGSCRIWFSTGKCIDVTGGNGASGTPFDIYTCHSGAAQELILPGDGTVRVFGMCMSVKATSNLTPIQLYNCDGSLGQQWNLLTNGQIKNPNSNRCLDVQGGVIQDRQPLILYDCRTTNLVNQATSGNCRSIATPPKNPQPTGSCKIEVAGKCVYVAFSNSASGTPLVIYTCLEVKAQSFAAPGDGTVRAFGKCMDVKATSNLTPVQLNDCNGGLGQQWIFLTSGQIWSPISNRCLDVAGGIIQNNQPLIIYDCRPTNFLNQAFVSTCQSVATIPKYPQPTGSCKITMSGKCVDVTGGSSANGTPLDIYTCNNNLAQNWTLPGDDTIRAFDKCMEVKDSGTSSLIPIQLNQCNGSPAQRWVFLSNGQLYNPFSETCVNIKNDIIQDGQPLITYMCKSTPGKQVVESSCKPIPPIIINNPQPSGSCFIRVAGKCVDLIGANTASGTLFDINTCSGNHNLTLAGDGTIKAYGKCMDVSAISNLTPVELYDCNGGAGQQWLFLSSGQIWHPISNRCLDVAGGVILDGQPLILYDCRSTNFVNQAFESNCQPLVIPPKAPQPTGSCKIAVGTKCVDVTGSNNASGTLFNVYECHDGANQQLVLPGDGTVTVLGKCMDLKGGVTTNMNPVELYDCDKGASQRWIFLSSGQLMNEISKRCLDVLAGAATDRQPLMINDCRTSDFGTQAFNSTCQPIVIPPKAPQPTGSCKIAVGTKCVDVTGSNNASGTLFNVYECHDGANQQLVLPGDGTVTVLGKCMDLKGGVTTNMNPVELYDCDKGASQRWIFLSSGQLMNEISKRCLDVLAGAATDRQPLMINDCRTSDFGTQAFNSTCQPIVIPPKAPQPTGSCKIAVGTKCVDVTGSNNASGTLFNVYECHDGANQQLVLPGDGTVTVLGKCMDLKGGVTTNMNPVELYDCDKGASQRWIFLSSGQLMNEISKRCLDVLAGAATDRQPLIINDCRTSDFGTQAFNSTCQPIVIPPKAPQPTGSCKIAVGTKCVDVTGSNNASGTLFNVYECHDGANQQLVLPGDGTVTVLGKCMDLKGGVTTNMNPVELYDCDKGASQRWIFLSSGQLMNEISKRCLDVLAGAATDRQPLMINDCRTSDFGTQAFNSTCQPIVIPPKAPQPTGSCKIAVGTKCVDVTGSNNASGTLFNVYECHDGANQQLVLPGDGTVTVLGKCMDLKGGVTTNMNPVELYDCDKGASQRWIFLSSGQLMNEISKRCLDVLAGAATDRQPLMINDCRTSDFGTQAFNSTCQPIVIPPKAPQPTGSCKITVGDKCVDVTGANSTNGTPFEIYACYGGAAQALTVPGDGTVRALGKCMEVKGAAMENLAQVQLYDCNGSDGQQWIFLSNGQIKNPRSNRCLDVAGGEIQDGKLLIIYDCGPSDQVNQVFKISCQPQPVGSCKITVDNKCVDVTGGYSASGTLFNIYKCHGGENQQLNAPGDGTIRVLGKCMHLKDDATRNLTPIDLYECDAGVYQQWAFLPSGQLWNPISNRCLDVLGGVTTDRQPLIITDCNTTDFATQGFQSKCRPIIPPIAPQPTGSCYITVAGQCLDLIGGDSTSGNRFEIDSCDGVPAQQLTVPGDGTIRSMDKCMEVSAIDNPTFVQVNDCNKDNYSQHWTFLSSGQLLNPISNRCLDVRGGLATAGQPLITNDCKASDFTTQGFGANCNDP